MSEWTLTLQAPQDKREKEVAKAPAKNQESKNLISVSDVINQDLKKQHEAHV